MIKINNLTKYYNTGQKKFVALKNVSLSIGKGEVICIVGSSGSGKSTLLRVLAGLEKDFEGSIEIDDKKGHLYLEENRIALVSQKYSSFPWMTVSQNVEIGFYEKGKTKEELDILTNKLLKRVGLFKVKDQYPDSLSGGMQQRIAIARAIAQDTEIIVFDEPFGALDVQTRTQMQEFLATLWEKEHRTMILVTHDIEEAIYLANRIFVLGVNPGTVRKVVEVDIERPRRSEIRFKDNFVRLKKFISYIIRSEAIKASLDEGVMTDESFFKMGLYIWAGNIPLYYANDSSLFSKEFIDIEQINFDNNSEKVKLWVDGRLDIINITLDMAIELRSKIPDLKIIRVMNRSAGGDGLIANGKIKSVRELKGKTVGVEKGSAGYFFLLYILNKEGLLLKDVKVKNMKSGEIGAAIISGEIDGGVLWEPWLSKVHELANVNTLKTTSDYPILYDVLIMRNEFYKKNTEEVQKIIKVFKKAYKDLEENRSEVVSVASSHIGISEKELVEYLNKIEFFEENPPDIFLVVEDIERVLLYNKKIKKICEPKDLFI